MAHTPTLAERLRSEQSDGWTGDATCVSGELATEAADAIDAMRGALRRIAFMRPAGATPKLVKGELIEQIEQIALAALASREG